MNFSRQQLPDPPQAFFRMIKLARTKDLWVKASRYDMRDEPRYAVTRPHSSHVMFASDDLDAIRSYLMDLA